MDAVRDGQGAKVGTMIKYPPEAAERPGRSIGNRISNAFGAPATLTMPACIIIAAGIVLPVGYMLILSAQTPDPGEVALTTDFTAESYLKFFMSPFYRGVLLKTIGISIVTTAICAVLGFTLAVSIWLTSPRWRGLCVLAVVSPLLVSIVTRAFGWMVVLGDNGLVNNVLIRLGVIATPLHLMFTNFAIVIGLVHVLLPLMTLPILTSLDRIDRNIPEAASSLGASALTIGTKILLPMIGPGLVSGVTMVFSLSMSSYILPALMGGADSGMMTTLIYQQFVVTFNWQFGAALVAILLATSLAIVAFLIFETTRRTRKWMVGR
jgi:putative spermidine/putrescine transport system permease protein